MKLQDVIRYYVGCDVIIDGKEIGRLMGGHFIPNSVNQIYYDIQTGEMKDVEGDDFSMPYNDDPDDPEPRVKPILRMLDDITEEEKIELFNCYKVLSDVSDSWKTKSITDWIKAGSDLWSFEQVHYLLKKGFDLFSLIENSLAIDSKTLK